MENKMNKTEIIRRVKRLAKKAREMERKGRCADTLHDEIDSLNERLAIVMEIEAFSVC